MSAVAPLRHVRFRFLIAGRTVNAFGNGFASIALAFAVLDITGSAGDLGLVVGVRTVFNVVFLLFGGVLADRLPQHRLMVGSAVVAGLSQGVAAALVLSHTATIPLLMVVGAVNGTVSALSMPASSSILPRTVPEEIRQQANAINRMTVSGANILGAPLGGVVVAALGPGWGIVVDALSFLLAALCFAFIRLSAVAAAEPGRRSHIVADLRTGWSEFRSRQWLWVVVAGFMVLNAAWSGGLLVLGPVVAKQTFGSGGWGLVLAAETAGMIAGGLIALRLRLRRMLLVGVVCCFPIALPLLALGLYAHLWLVVACAFVAGVFLEQFGVAWETTMQEHVPADKLARVYSYDMVGSFVAMPIGEVGVGPLARAFGVEATLIGAAVLIMLAVAGMLSSGDVRSRPHQLAEPAGPPVTESVP
jgi:MFS family permease